jgi:hypothetical protein
VVDSQTHESLMICDLGRGVTTAVPAMDTGEPWSSNVVVKVHVIALHGRQGGTA